MKHNIKLGKIDFFDDQKTEISSATIASQLISIPYLDTNAGSNPREFLGVTTTNEDILKSILSNSVLFWAKHSGVILTILNTKIDQINFDELNGRKGTISYSDVCLTNGLQTVSILRILLIIKVYQISTKREHIHTKITKKMIAPLSEALKEELGETVAEFLMDNIAVKQMSKILYWFHKDDNTQYYDIINKLSVEDILNIRVSFKAVRLDPLLEYYKPNLYGDDISKELGYDIATSNNSTQSVKEDDKFGTVHKEWLDKHLMKDIINDVDIIYRINSKNDDSKDISKHILDLLRAIIPTTIFINNEKFENSNQLPSIISSYASNRVPIYRFFEKLIKKYNENQNDLQLKDAIIITRNLMPDLVKVMLNFESTLKSYYKNDLTFNKVCDLLSYGMPNDKQNLKVRLGCDPAEENEEVLNKAARKSLSFSSNVLFPIFIYASYRCIEIDDKLNVTYIIHGPNFKKIMEKCIYRVVLESRITRQHGSTSDLFRDPRIYIQAKNAFDLMNDIEKDSIAPFRINLADI